MYKVPSIFLVKKVAMTRQNEILAKKLKNSVQN